LYLKRLYLITFGLLLCVACNSANGAIEQKELRTGRALKEPYVSWLRQEPVQPGSQWVVLAATLENSSRDPIILRDIDVHGDAVAPVIRVKRVEIAPLQTTELALRTASGGIFGTYPPVQGFRHDGRFYCARQRLVPVEGYTLGPGREANVLLLLEAGRPGKYRIDSHVVKYESSGTRFVQVLRAGTRGAVERGAKGPNLNATEVRCVSRSRLLPGVRQRSIG
jgi:hypothetical protein